eukprot:TRINITY_DN8234_c0_g1_i4.p1 TRINITY_DN8234_c0_g1~~TRINITY_DN8234_c0_g1_i4.p1  ORF type:complete len:615 (+),score=172.06 TRINITY_DN8234_c0_g1_i4:51-1847(+)
MVRVAAVGALLWLLPAAVPTSPPSASPSATPSLLPSGSPTAPSGAPSAAPSVSPSATNQTSSPTAAPSVTSASGDDDDNSGLLAALWIAVVLLLLVLIALAVLAYLHYRGPAVRRRGLEPRHEPPPTQPTQAHRVPPHVTATARDEDAPRPLAVSREPIEASGRKEHGGSVPEPAVPEPAGGGLTARLNALRRAYSVGALTLEQYDAAADRLVSGGEPGWALPDVDQPPSSDRQPRMTPPPPPTVVLPTAPPPTAAQPDRTPEPPAAMPPATAAVSPAAVSPAAVSPAAVSPAAVSPAAEADAEEVRAAGRQLAHEVAMLRGELRRAQEEFAASPAARRSPLSFPPPASLAKPPPPAPAAPLPTQPLPASVSPSAGVLQSPRPYSVLPTRSDDSSSGAVSIPPAQPLHGSDELASIRQGLASDFAAYSGRIHNGRTPYPVPPLPASYRVDGGSSPPPRAGGPGRTAPALPQREPLGTQPLGFAQGLRAPPSACSVSVGPQLTGEAEAACRAVLPAPCTGGVLPLVQAQGAGADGAGACAVSGTHVALLQPPSRSGGSADLVGLVPIAGISEIVATSDGVVVLATVRAAPARVAEGRRR